MNTTIRQSTFSIEDVPQLLSFYPDSNPSYEALLKDFRALVKDRFHDILNQAEQVSPDVVQELQAKIGSFSEEEFDRIVTIPAFLNRVFRMRSESALDKTIFWTQILDRQISVRDNVIDGEKWPAFWTLDGAAFMRAQEDGKDPVRFDAPRLYDTVVMDFFSEVNAGLGGDEYLAFDSNEEMGDYSFEEAEALLEQIGSCLDPVTAPVENLLSNFMHVVHFRKAVGSNATSSSTNGGFIGRILIGNTEIYEPELLAEAMVHEAMHGVLFILDELKTWMPGTREENAQHHHIRSPWSGNLLTPRNIFQACFIWYGLYKFFDAHRDAYSNKALIKKQMDKIRNGFKNLPMESLLEDRFPQTFATIQKVASEVVNHTPGK